MEDMDVGFDTFLDAFDSGEDGNQTGTTEETETVEAPEKPTEESQEQPGSGETTEEEQHEGAEKATAKGSAKDGAEPSFTIKVNKEQRQVGLTEMTELAQKGADYDRTKGQLEESRQTVQSLQARLDEQQGYMDVLKLISEQTETPLDALIEQMHINLLKGKGMSEAEAKAEIRASRAEKRLSTIQEQERQQKTAQEGSAARAAREVAEFREQFPGVDITPELCEKLAPHIQAGMTMTSAYLKMENARKDAEIAELQRKQAAAEQNRKNHAQSPGSQRDSGGQRAKSDFDEFMAAFA